MEAGKKYWDYRKAKLLKMYENLTHKDLEFKLGQENIMLAALAEKLGKSHQELLRLIVTL
jgi:hypothetical protein